MRSEADPTSVSFLLPEMYLRSTYGFHVPVCTPFNLWEGAWKGFFGFQCQSMSMVAQQFWLDSGVGMEEEFKDLQTQVHYVLMVTAFSVLCITAPSVPPYCLQCCVCMLPKERRSGVILLKLCCVENKLSLSVSTCHYPVVSCKRTSPLFFACIPDDNIAFIGWGTCLSCLWRKKHLGLKWKLCGAQQRSSFPSLVKEDPFHRTGCGSVLVFRCLPSW